MECFRRLALASAVGIVDAGSAVSALLGVLICLAFLFVFIRWEPFKAKEDSDLGVVLSYALTFFFLSALLVKVDIISDGASEQQLFGIILIMLLGSGPIAIMLQLSRGKFASWVSVCGDLVSTPRYANEEEEEEASEGDQPPSANTREIKTNSTSISVGHAEDRAKATEVASGAAVPTTGKLKAAARKELSKVVVTRRVHSVQQYEAEDNGSIEPEDTSKSMAYSPMRPKDQYQYETKSKAPTPTEPGSTPKTESTPGFLESVAGLTSSLGVFELAPMASVFTGGTSLDTDDTKEKKIDHTAVTL